MSDVVCPRNLPWNECGSLGLCDPLTEYCNPTTLTCAPCSQLCPNPDNLCLTKCYCTWIIAVGKGYQNPSISTTPRIEKGDYGWKELDSVSKAALITLSFLLIGLIIVIVGICLFKNKHTKNFKDNKKSDSYQEEGILLKDQASKDASGEKKTDVGIDQEQQQQWSGKCTWAGKPLRRETIGTPCQRMPVQPSSTSAMNEQINRLPARHTAGAALAIQQDSTNNGRSSAVQPSSALRSDRGRQDNPGLVNKTTITSPIQAADYCIPQVNFVNAANATCPDPALSVGREQTTRKTLENEITLSCHTPDNTSFSLSFPPSPAESLELENLDTGYNTTVEAPQMTTKSACSS